MNGQGPPVRHEWKELLEEFKIAVHNSEIQLELFKAQLKEAEAHSRGG